MLKSIILISLMLTFTVIAKPGKHSSESIESIESKSDESSEEIFENVSSEYEVTLLKVIQ